MNWTFKPASTPFILPHRFAMFAYYSTRNCRCQSTFPRSPASVFFNSAVCDKSDTSSVGKSQHSWCLRSCSRDSTIATLLSVLAGLPRFTTEPFQRVLNAAARLVVGLKPFDSVTPALKQLRWLPIEHSIKIQTVPAHALSAHQQSVTVSDRHRHYCCRIQCTARSSIR